MPFALFEATFFTVAASFATIALLFGDCECWLMYLFSFFVSMAPRALISFFTSAGVDMMLNCFSNFEMWAIFFAFVGRARTRAR